MNAQIAKYYPDESLISRHPSDYLRAEHSRLRFAMLRGEWGTYLEKALKTHLPHLRRIAWGPQDMTSNVFRGIASEVGGVPYMTEPGGTVPDGGEALTGQGGILDLAGYWPLMQGTCEDLVGLREMGMRLSYSTEGGLVPEPIPPHLIDVHAPPWAPLSPDRISCYDLREDPDKPGAYLWTRETWDTTELRYGIFDASKPDRDLTRAYATKDGQPASSSDLSGEGYYWRWTQGDRKGRPFIPVPIYHAMRRAEMWDAWYGVEAVAGSLTLAVLHTFWVHCVRDGSIATIAVINGIPAGIQIEPGDGSSPPIAWVAIEAGAFNLFTSEPDKQVQLVQLQPQARPLELIQAIQAFEARLAIYAGVSASDLVRQSGDPRSGYALAVSSEGKRRASRRLEPQLRAGDTQAMEIAAALHNITTGDSIPETGYRPSYGVLPVAIEERQAVLAHVRDAMATGLMTRRDGLRLLRPDLSESDITTYLAQAAAERSALAITPAL